MEEKLLIRAPNIKQNISINSIMLSSAHRNRIKKDIQDLTKDPIENINIYVNDANTDEWYFLIMGLKGSEYEGGEFIGKIVLDEKYPFSPPEYYMITPNGRFDDGKKICLDNSKFHKNNWSPEWRIDGIIRGFLSIMLDDVDKGISHIFKSKEERKKLAKASIKWNQDKMGKIYKKLKTEYLGHISLSEKVNKLISQIDNEESSSDDDGDILEIINKTKKLLRKKKED